MVIASRPPHSAMCCAAAVFSSIEASSVLRMMAARADLHHRLDLGIGFGGDGAVEQFEIVRVGVAQDALRGAEARRRGRR